MNVKELIKPGMVIVTKARGNYLAAEVNNTILLFNNTGYNRLDSYRDDGICNISHYNIKEIRKMRDVGSISYLLEETNNYNVVWRREDVIYLSELISSDLFKLMKDCVLFIDDEIVYKDLEFDRICLENRNILYTSNGIGLYKITSGAIYLPEKIITIPIILDVEKIIKGEYGINITKIYKGAKDPRLFWNTVEGSIVWESPHIYRFTRKYLANYFNVSEDFEFVIDY